MGQRANAGHKIRVLIIEDHKVVAEAMSALLNVTDGMEVVDRVYDTGQIVDKINQHKPDIVICDLEMPGGDPLDSAAEAIRENPGTRLMILTAYPTDAHITRACKIGVHAFMTKHEPADTIIDAIHAVMTGHVIYSDEIRDRMVQSDNGVIRECKVLMLSPRELAIVRLVAQGMTTPQIAEKVFRSPKTVDNQISSAMSKTKSANRVELSRWAIREGLVQA